MVSNHVGNANVASVVEFSGLRVIWRAISHESEHGLEED